MTTDLPNEQIKAMGSPEDRPSALEYSLGLLNHEDETAFEQRMLANEDLRDEAEGNAMVISKFADIYERMIPAPRKGLKDKVMQFALGHEHQSTGSEGSTKIVRATEGEWVESGLPGMQIKFLYFEPATERHTVLVRMAPGTHYPSHRHNGTEECLVIEGELRVDDDCLAPGDYIVNQDGSIHKKTWSDTGCVLLLSTGMKDDMLE